MDYVMSQMMMEKIHLMWSRQHVKGKCKTRLS